METFLMLKYDNQNQGDVISMHHLEDEKINNFEII